MRRRTLHLSLITIGLALCTTCCATAQLKPQPIYLYDSLVFEIAPVSSFAQPDPAAWEFFVDRLHQNRICRRSRVVLNWAQPPAAMPHMMLTLPMIAQHEHLHRRLRDPNPDDRNAVVFVPYFRGPLIMDGRSLGGIQYSPSSFALVGPSGREAAVLLHEMGHLIGLLKDGVGEDPLHPHHCPNPRCVMYFSSRGAYSDFDAPCKRRLARLIRNARR